MEMNLSSYLSNVQIDEDDRLIIFTEKRLKKYTEDILSAVNKRINEILDGNLVNEDEVQEMVKQILLGE